MSSALYSAVPNALTGPNYLEWAQSMQSYLMAQGQWNMIISSPPQAADVKAIWDDNDLCAQGNLRLCLAPSMISAVSSKMTAADI